MFLKIILKICKISRQFQVGNWIYKSGAQGTEQSCGYGLGSYQDTDGVKKTSFTYCLEIILLESQIYFPHINPVTRKSRQRGLTVPARNWVYEFMQKQSYVTVSEVINSAGGHMTAQVHKSNLLPRHILIYTISYTRQIVNKCNSPQQICKTSFAVTIASRLKIVVHR